MLPSLTQSQPQSNATGAGMPMGSMQELMDKAKMFSDSQLADVLQGKLMDIPQYVAMTEAMGRQQLRTAMQGAQAQQQGKQPTVKDQLLSDEERAAQQEAGTAAQQPMGAPAPAEQAQGIAALPADNMAPKQMAAGGIIAFDDGGPVNRAQVDKAYQDWQESKGPWYMPTPAGSGAKEREQAYLDTLNKYQTTAGTAAQYGTPVTPPATTQAAAPAITPAMQAEIDKQSAATPPAAPAGGLPSIAAPADVEAINKRIAPQNLKKTELPSYEDVKKAQEVVQRPDVFAGLEGSKEEMDKKVQSEKDFGLGQYLMHLGSAMMSTPNLGMALAKGSEAGLPGIVASRKVINELESKQKEFNFNLAKAKEARDQGNEELALKHDDLAQKISYQTGTLAVENRKAASGEIIAGADVVKANAMAASVGSKADIKNEKRNQAVLASIDNLYKSDMGNSMFAMQFAKMNPQQKEDYYQSLRDRAVKDYNAITSAGNSAGFKYLGTEK